MSAISRWHERDDPLVAAAKQGDSDAWRELYRAHAGRLVLWLQHRSPGDAAASAEDLCHEAWETAASKIHDFTGGVEDFGGWLFGIARRHAANARRRSGRRSTTPLEPVDLEPHAGSVGGPETTVPEQDWIRRALDELSARERDVMVCLEVIGMDLSMTCVALGMSAVSVRVARHRALKRLRKVLGEAEPRQEPAPAPEACERPIRAIDVTVRTP